MANANILAQKQEVINEIKDRIDNAGGVVFFDYRGLTDAEAKELRRSLKDAGADYKIYKNTLITRALDELKIKFDEDLFGPSALAYANDEIAPIKVLSEFAKTHPAVELKVGIVDKEVTGKEKLAQLATIPSREGLLTMLAGGMIGIARDLSICLDLYAKQKEEN